MPTFLRCVKGLDIAACSPSHHFCTHTSTDLVEIPLDLPIYTYLGAAYGQPVFLGQFVLAQFNSWSVIVLGERRHTCKLCLHTPLSILTYKFRRDDISFEYVYANFRSQEKASPHCHSTFAYVPSCTWTQRLHQCAISYERQLSAPAALWLLIDTTSCALWNNYATHVSA